MTSHTSSIFFAALYSCHCLVNVTIVVHTEDDAVPQIFLQVEIESNPAVPSLGLSDASLLPQYPPKYSEHPRNSDCCTNRRTAFPFHSSGPIDPSYYYRRSVSGLRKKAASIGLYANNAIMCLHRIGKDLASSRRAPGNFLAWVTEVRTKLRFLQIRTASYFHLVQEVVRHAGSFEGTLNIQPVDLDQTVFKGDSTVRSVKVLHAHV